MSRTIAITDIHGCYKTFQKLINDEVQLTKDDELFILGDYIDRGPDSKKVIDSILEKQAEGFNINCLLGNHELMMINSQTDARQYRLWTVNGGDVALQSFGNPLEAIEDKYWNFLNDLPYYYQTDEYLFVHAGLNLNAENPLEEKEAMVWVRDWNNDHQWQGEQIIIHGHTPISKEQIEKSLTELDKVKVLNIDAGCYAKDFEEGLGYLCAFDLSNRQLYFQTNIDKVTWRPPVMYR